MLNRLERVEKHMRFDLEVENSTRKAKQRGFNRKSRVIICSIFLSPVSSPVGPLVTFLVTPQLYQNDLEECKPPCVVLEET